jgi:anti-sigma factor RsiW
MTPCEEIVRLALLRESGEIDPADERRLKRHLEACPACRRAVKADAETTAFLRAVRPAPGPDPAVRRTVLAHTSQRLRHRRRSRVIRLASTGLATAASILFIFLITSEDLRRNPVGPGERQPLPLEQTLESCLVNPEESGTLLDEAVADLARAEALLASVPGSSARTHVDPAAGIESAALETIAALRRDLNTLGEIEF